MKRFQLLLAVAALSLFVAEAVAAIPQHINIQGILRDSTGAPVSDGVYTVRFRIYDDSTAGNQLWQETLPVPTKSGLFRVQLGEASPLSDDLFTVGSDRFLEFRINLDPAMSRMRLTSVAYAFHALHSDSAGTATLSLDLTCSGCVDGSDILDGSIGVLDLGTNSVTSEKIQDGTIALSDIGDNGAASGEIMKWNGSQWVVGVDATTPPSGWTDDGSILRLTADTDSVGIGTANPTKKLEIAGSVKLGNGDTLFANHISSDSSFDIQAPAGTVRMFINNANGKVGIGTTDPVGALEVRGGVAITSFFPGLVPNAGNLIVTGKVQIGTTTGFGDPSTLYVQGSIASDVTTVTSSTTLTSSRSVVLVNTGTATITLPSAGLAPGRQYTIKKISAAAGTITVDGNGSDTIDGALTYNLSSQYSSVSVVSHGSAWYVVSSH